MKTLKIATILMTTIVLTCSSKIFAGQEAKAVATKITNMVYLAQGCDQVYQAAWNAALETYKQEVSRGKSPSVAYDRAFERAIEAAKQADRQCHQSNSARNPVQRQLLRNIQNRHIRKLQRNIQKQFCVCCGEEIDMTLVNSTQIYACHHNSARSRCRFCFVGYPNCPLCGTNRICSKKS